MPDISMCLGITTDRACPKRDRCHRFTSSSHGPAQSYFQGLPFEEKDGVVECEMFTFNGAKEKP